MARKYLDDGVLRLSPRPAWGLGSAARRSEARFSRWPVPSSWKRPLNLELTKQGFDLGNLYLSRPNTGALVGRQPFGGHGLSGVGATAGGGECLMQFVVAPVVSEQTLHREFAPPK